MRRSLYRVLLGAIACQVLSGFSSALSKPAVTDAILYHEVDGKQLRLDLARPSAAGGPHPLLIYIHGGGWKEGHRRNYRGQIVEAAKRGFVAASISHRLTAERGADGAVRYPWPAAIHDVKAAIRFLREHAQEHRIDPDRIGVIGASSGGHLALLAGLTHARDGLEPDSADESSTAVQAVVNIAGPTDMPKAYHAPVVTRYAHDFLGGAPHEQPEAYRRASPLTFYDAEDPPVLTFHSRQDAVVPVEHATMLHAKAQEVGARHTLRLFDDPDRSAPSSHNLPEGRVYREALEFFAQEFLAPHGTLFIAGGGKLPGAVLDRFVELAGGDSARLVVIPTAGAGKPSAGSITELWNQRGVPSVAVLHTRDPARADDPVLVAPLRRATSVWISGGAQSRLASAYLGTEVQRELKAVVRRGGVVGGSSAGAAIQSEVMIVRGNPVPEIGKGLGLIAGVVIDQHFLARNRPNRLLAALRQRPQGVSVGVGIDEGTAIEVRRGSATVRGASFAIVIEAAADGSPRSVESYSDGERFDLSPAAPRARAGS